MKITFKFIFLTLVFLLFTITMPSSVLAVEQIYPTINGTQYTYWDATLGWITDTRSTNDPGHTKNSYAGQTITVPANIGLINYIYFYNVWVGTDDCSGTKADICNKQLGMSSEIRVYRGASRSNLIGSARADVAWSGGVHGYAYAFFSAPILVNPDETIYFELYSLDNLDTRDGLVVKVPVSTSNPYSGGTAYYNPDVRYQLTAQSGSDLAEVRVYGTQVSVDNASCEVVSPPSSPIYPGTAYTVSVQMKNTGNTTWNASTYYLGSLYDITPPRWSVNAVHPPYSITPTSSGAFNFSITTPASPGTYPFFWQMVNASGNTFGASCGTNITVVPTPTPTPGAASLGDQIIVANTADGSTTNTGSTVRTSGLRSDQGGKSYYNSIIITQKVNSPSGATLVGAAFTNQNQAPSGSLLSLMSSADTGNGFGFVLVYANVAKNVPSVPEDTASSKSLPANTHWFYFNRRWYDITSLPAIDPNSKIQAWTNAASTPTNRVFYVRFLSPLQSRSWGNYGYLMQNDASHTETSVPK